MTLRDFVRAGIVGSAVGRVVRQDAENLVVQGPLLLARRGHYLMLTSPEPGWPSACPVADPYDDWQFMNTDMLASGGIGYIAACLMLTGLTRDDALAEARELSSSH